MLIRLFIALIAVSTTIYSADVFAAVGRTQGQFNVSATGSAQYNIPIWAPPGPRNMQPNLSLFYDSQASIGPLGIGWSLAGLGAITRCNLTAAQDAAPAPVNLVAGDGYCLNGNRLRLTSGTYGTAGSTYQTEIADFSNITAVGTAGSGPASWTVQERNGLTYYYGFVDANGNGASSAAVAAGTSTVLTWYLSKVMDRAGNNYVINYTSVSGAAVPAKILWTPESSGSAMYTYSMVFIYNPNVAQSSFTEYVAGTLVSNTQLLSSIEVLVGTTVVKDYFLKYQQSPLTAREQLKTITECADAGESNCLSPTSVTYGIGTPGLSTVVNTALSSAGVSLTTRYDLNGDGYPDLVYISPSGSMVAFGSAAGYGTPISAGVGSNLIGNLTGGPEDGLLVNKSGTWWYYLWNGSEFVGTSTGLTIESNETQVQLADVNGDGRPDLVGLYTYTVSTPRGTQTRSKVEFHLNNTSTGGAASFNSSLVDAGANFLYGAELWIPDAQWGKLRRYDFNGDGLDDLVVVLGGGSGNSTYVDTWPLISTGSGYTVGTPIQLPGSTYTPIYFTNWNDDKCTDFVAGNTLNVSACNGNAAQSYALTGTVVAALDWDGDGRTDLMVQDGSSLGVYISEGSGTPVLSSTSIPYSSNCQYIWLDANGDGLDDLGCWSQTGTNNPITYYLHNGAADLAASFADGFGNSVSPSYLPLTQANYTPGNTTVSFPNAPYTGTLEVVTKSTFSDPSSSTGATYNVKYSYFQATTNLQGLGFNGFGEINALDSRNGLSDNKYYGFNFPFTGMLVQESVLNGTKQVSTAGGTPLSIILNTNPDQERSFPYFPSWTVDQYEVGGIDNGVETSQSVTTTTYDNYGNATSVVTAVTDLDPNSPYLNHTWTTTTTNTTDISVNQSTDLASWCLTMLDETVVAYTSTAPGVTAVTRTQQFTPDTPAACRIKDIVTEPTANKGLYKVTEALTFDSFGNIETDTITGSNMPNSPASRLTTYNWGTTGQFLNTLTDPSSATTTWTYQSTQSLGFGVPDNVQDPNNLKTSWGYDAFGRKTSETRPDSTSTSWTWTLCTSACGWSNSVYSVARATYQSNGSTVLRTDTTSYDPVDRPTQVVGPTVTGASATTQELYNPMGLPAQRSMPFLSGTPYQQSFAYDPLNRLTETQRPINSGSNHTYCNPTLPPISGCQGTSYAYAGRTQTLTDPLGHTKTTVTDVNGRLIRTKDGVGYQISRTLDAAGSLIGVSDNVGNTLLSGVSVVYGIKPFRTADNDADRGPWTYTVDSLGEKYGWTDAKKNSFSMTYDALSRPLTRAEPDLFTQWQWGSTPASHNVGQLIYKCTGTGTVCTSADYSETRTFDSTGRLSTSAVTEGGYPGNDPGGVFLFTRGYSPTTGLLSTLTYPKSTSSFALTLQYAYGYGLLQSVTDTTDTTSTCGTSCTLWAADGMNGFGQVTSETLGNGAVTTRKYDAVTGWLTRATSGTGGGATLLNQSYAHYEDGTLMQRQDNNFGLTENFDYDADRRLTCATLSGNTCSTPTFVYDGGVAGPGNITNQSGLVYTYPAPGQPRPHAVTGLIGSSNGVTNPTFSYDANGNMTTRASPTPNITWSSYNYPIDINNDVLLSEDVQLFYGPDRQRWKQIYTTTGLTETTYYIGGLVDLVSGGGTTNFRHYIYAGGEPIAVYSRTVAGANTMSYLLEDHLGSVSTIASNSAGVDVNESFSAFGEQRNPTTWSSTPSQANLNVIASLTRQGYTFQTMLGELLGLNHMNGRVQDAILGRFLSPDPHITDPSNAQNYNRYGYVNNDPLDLYDPTGFDCVYGNPDGSATPVPCSSDQVDVPGQTIIENYDGSEEIQGTASRSTDQPVDVGPLGLSIISSGGGPGGGGGGGSGNGTNGTRQAQSQTQTPYNPWLCVKTGKGCDSSVNGPPTCIGSFSFFGLEVDGAEGGAFSGAIVDSSVQGMSVGSLSEGWAGGESGVAGGAYVQDSRTGTLSGFAFVGVGISAGFLAGAQVGFYYARSNDFGLYLEGHRGSVAGGSGVGTTPCPQ